VGNSKKVHLDMVLDDMANVGLGKDKTRGVKWVTFYKRVT
jgi:hypothetical protein